MIYLPTVCSQGLDKVKLYSFITLLLIIEWYNIVSDVWNKYYILGLRWMFLL